VGHHAIFNHGIADADGVHLIAGNGCGQEPGDGVLGSKAAWVHLNAMPQLLAFNLDVGMPRR
jgi:hypothetical protein